MLAIDCRKPPNIATARASVARNSESASIMRAQRGTEDCSRISTNMGSGAIEQKLCQRLSSRKNCRGQPTLCWLEVLRPDRLAGPRPVIAALPGVIAALPVDRSTVPAPFAVAAAMTHASIGRSARCERRMKKEEGRMNRASPEHRRDSEPPTASDCHAEVVLPESITEAPAPRKYRPGVFQDPIGGVDAQERSPGQLDLGAAAKFQGRQRASGRERAGQGRRKDRDTGDGTGRFTKREKSRACLRERPHAFIRRARRHAKQPFNLTRAERALAWKFRGIRAKCRLDTQQRRWPPRHESTDTARRRLEIA